MPQRTIYTYTEYNMPSVENYDEIPLDGNQCKMHGDENDSVILADENEYRMLPQRTLYAYTEYNMPSVENYDENHLDENQYKMHGDENDSLMLADENEYTMSGAESEYEMTDKNVYNMSADEDEYYEMRADENEFEMFADETDDDVANEESVLPVNEEAWHNESTEEDETAFSCNIPLLKDIQAVRSCIRKNVELYPIDHKICLENNLHTLFSPYKTLQNVEIEKARRMRNAELSNKRNADSFVDGLDFFSAIAHYSYTHFVPKKATVPKKCPSARPPAIVHDLHSGILNAIVAMI